MAANAPTAAKTGAKTATTTPMVSGIQSKFCHPCLDDDASNVAFVYQLLDFGQNFLAIDY